MKYLGIDYGEKNIGIAVSDENGGMAFPLKVIKNSKKTLAEVKKIFVDEKAESVVLGESLNLKGEPNKIMEDIKVFKENLEKEIGKQVYFEPEFYTTQHSLHIQGRTPMTDASAAALILQSFLDKRKNRI